MLGTTAVHCLAYACARCHRCRQSPSNKRGASRKQVPHSGDVFGPAQIFYPKPCRLTGRAFYPAQSKKCKTMLCNDFVRVRLSRQALLCITTSQIG